MKRCILCLLAAALPQVTPGIDPVTYHPQAFATNDPIDSEAAEAAFLDAVTRGGFSTFSEGFEAPAWEQTRSPGSAERVESHRIAWHASTGNHVRTVRDSDSYAVPQPYMIYGLDPASGFHPAPNTLIGESDVTLYGLGFWADGTGTKGKIKVILDDSVEVKFQRIIGYTENPPDPPEPIKVTARLGYEKEFYGVYAPDGFTKFQLLEFAGEFDEVVLMWMRTFTFAITPPVSVPDLRIVGMTPTGDHMHIFFSGSSAYSHATVEARPNLCGPHGWAGVSDAPVIVSQDLYRATAALPTEKGQVFRIFSAP